MKKELIFLRKILLSIAGYDPTSGAGVLLDLKAFEHLGFQGMAILTSLTSQNTRTVKEVHCLSPDFLQNQYQTLCYDISFSGIKVGMVGSQKNIQVIAAILSNNPKIPKVIDPVFKSSSGTWLFEKEAIPSYISKIRGKASLFTPNMEEASMISGIKMNTPEDMKEAAEQIYKLSYIPCLIKGGDLPNQKLDLLFDGKKYHFFKKEKIEKKVHGTGCFLSSSLLAYLVKGNPLEKACSLASQLTHKAIKAATQIGQGQHIIHFSI